MRCPFAFALLLALPAAALATPPDWTPAGPFSNTMSVVATLHFDGAPADYPNDLLAAFVGGESRGLAAPVRLGNTSSYVFFLTVGSNAVRDGETITFKAYDASTDTERLLCERLTFRDGSSRGTPGAPFAFHAEDGASFAGTCPLSWTAPTGFSQQMIVNAAMYFEGILATDSQDRVAAFVGEELRGVGDPVTDPNGDQYYQMVIWGDVAGEAITFQTYDHSTQLTYAPSVTIRFAPGTIEGTASNPIPLDASTPLPVELTVFGGTQDGAVVRLYWATESETNNAGFEVQLRAREEFSGHPSNTASWRPLAFVAGQGTTAERHVYEHTATGLAPGTYAFRLKQVDFDGAFSHSSEVEIVVVAPAGVLLADVYPNPFAEKLHVTVSTARTQRMRILLYDLLGRLVAQLHEGVLEGGVSQTITFDDVLADGQYLVRVEGEHMSENRVVTCLRSR